MDQASVSDAAQLAAMGYISELPRNLSPVSMLGMAFAILNSWSVLSASLYLSLSSGGPSAAVWGLVDVGICNLSGIVFGRVPLSLSHRRRSISLGRCHLPTSTRHTFSLADRVDQRLWMDCDHRLRKPSRQPARCEHRGQQQRRSSTPPSRGVSLVHRFHIDSICCQLLDEQHPAVPEQDGLALERPWFRWHPRHPSRSERFSLRDAAFVFGSFINRTGWPGRHQKL
jgi:hypothetical protein